MPDPLAVSSTPEPGAPETSRPDGAAISCDSCSACCCRLEVLLMAEDAVPLHLTAADPWGAQVMARLEDGWCAALDRYTMRCRIYERRPVLCRDYALGGSDCMAERSSLDSTILRRVA